MRITVEDIEDFVNEYIVESIDFGEKKKVVKAARNREYKDFFSDNIIGNDIVVGSDLWDKLVDYYWEDANHLLNDNLSYGSRIDISDFYTLITTSYIVTCDSCRSDMCVIPQQNIDDTCYASGEFNGRRFELTLCQSCFDQIDQLL